MHILLLFVCLFFAASTFYLLPIVFLLEPIVFLSYFLIFKSVYSLLLLSVPLSYKPQFPFILLRTPPNFLKFSFFFLNHKFISKIYSFRTQEDEIAFIWSSRVSFFPSRVFFSSSSSCFPQNTIYATSLFTWELYVLRFLAIGQRDTQNA